MKCSGRHILLILALLASLLVSTVRATPAGLATGEGKQPQVAANSISLGDSRQQTPNDLLVLSAIQPLLGQTWMLADLGDSSGGYQRIVYRKPLSKGTGVLLALVPGLAVHGLGNFYGHNYGRGALLLAAEFVSIYFQGLTLFGIGDAGNAPIPVLGLPAVGYLIFFGSWMLDVFTVDSAVEKYNSYVGVSIKASRDGMRICLSYAF